ncbi:beta-lactamase [Rhizobium etli bv. phaseoli str. IE4803]|nr:beta-lactamase [Rhizobium etli bv. phaseoli str. IE4803]
MTVRNLGIKIFSAAVISVCGCGGGFAADEADVRAIADAAIKPIMEKHAIPGVAVGITVDGQDLVFTYGVESKETDRPVAPTTLFELGSISKTFTATLASYAEATGDLSLSDPVAKYLPAMQGRPFGDIALIDLATHTAGGFPLQVPDEIKSEGQLMEFLAAWRLSYPAGTQRSYANPSIGMLGFITAKAMRGDFADLMESRLFPALGLTSTYLTVPKSRQGDYAQGYKRSGEPARLTPGLLSAEAYGVRSTAGDMIRFVGANIGLAKLDGKLQQAIDKTHTGYFSVGAMTQDLIWEQYAYPATLQSLIEGNSAAMLKTIPVAALQPPMKPRGDVWINKTGSTNGFGAYVAFIPSERLGIVILANKNYPNEDRVAAAYRVLTALAAD